MLTYHWSMLVKRKEIITMMEQIILQTVANGTLFRNLDYG